MLTGLKTILIGLLMAALPPVAQYIGGVDWTTVLPASVVWLAPTISGLIMVGMRFVTTTPVLQKPQ